MAGKYQVSFGGNSGYYFTKQDQGGDDAKDSDANSSGATGTITLAAGQQNLTIDAGMYQKAKVGDLVWEDWDHDNVQDVGEGGIGCIKVQLFTAAGVCVGTTYTDAITGKYQFADLDPGQYYLQFDKTNVTFNKSHWGGSYNMSTWKWAVKDAGTNDALDSDVTGDATATTNVTKTSVFTLTSGQNDMSKDAGITPIAIDLNGDGVQTVSRENSSGKFDLFGNGNAIDSGWLSSDDGFLAVDNNANGKIDDISELFGGTSKGTGFAKLADFDSNDDGFVNADDSDFSSLLIWQDKNGNHQSDDGELFSLIDAGVSELVVGHTDLPFMDAQGNLHFERSSATLVTGQSVDMTDVYFNISQEDANVAGIEVNSMADFLANTAYAEQNTVIETVGVATLEPVFLG